MEYSIPSCTQRVEFEINKSRFITTAGFAPTVEDVKLFISDIRKEFPSSSHNVYAFRVGYGNSIVEGMSDDGEPSGTSGPPVLSVIRGTTIGDIVIVVTRFFGGRKLGTGGLVRAYTQSAQEVLRLLPLEQKVERVTISIVTPYPFYDQIKRLVESLDGHIESEIFTEHVNIVLTLRKAQTEIFSKHVQELSAGKLVPIIERTF